MKDYIPEGDQEFLTWLTNFAVKLSTYNTAFGITSGEAAAVDADLNMLGYLMGGLNELRPAMKSWTAYKDLIRLGPLGSAPGSVPALPPIADPPAAVPPGIEPRARSLAQRIKSHVAYTAAIGEDMGIVAASTPVDPVKPPAAAIAQPGSQVRIDWQKQGFDGVYVEGQRAAETAWTPLGIDLVSPYVDARAPLAAGAPEIRRYRLRYLKSDAAVGDYSDVITVTTNP